MRSRFEAVFQVTMHVHQCMKQGYHVWANILVWYMLDLETVQNMRASIAVFLPEVSHAPPLTHKTTDQLKHCSTWQALFQGPGGRPAEQPRPAPRCRHPSRHCVRIWHSSAHTVHSPVACQASPDQITCRKLPSRLRPQLGWVADQAPHPSPLLLRHTCVLDAAAAPPPPPPCTHCLPCTTADSAGSTSRCGYACTGHGGGRPSDIGQRSAGWEGVCECVYVCVCVRLRAVDMTFWRPS
eukprot:scaffold41697_cov19-Tisochrysis_lutea.AAC.4